MPKYRGITPKQKKFADEYLETGNGKQSALKAYNTDSGEIAASIASENLIKPNVLDYLKEHANNAASVIIGLSNNAENETVRLNASKDILDRSGFKPTEKSVNLNLDVQMDNDDIRTKKLREDVEEQLRKIYEV